MGWDKGVDFDKIHKSLVSSLNKFLREKRYRSAAYAITSLIILRNGCRVSEAIDAIKNFYKGEYQEKEGKIITYVRVRKKKKKEERIIVLPEQVDIKTIQSLPKLIVQNINRHKITMFLKYHYQINSHTLRYAFITHFARLIDSSLISKFIRHSNLSMLNTYVRKKLADEIFINLKI